MTNYNKSFNFRNGVQVDVDKFIVRGSLVGIGTSLPTERFEVTNGNAKFNSLLIANNQQLSGIGTFNEIRSGSFIAIQGSSGVVTATAFYGNGATLSNLPTSQWIDVNEPGLGFTSIYAQGNVGIATTSPFWSLQIGGNPEQPFRNGVGINSNGNIYTTGIISAFQYVGSGAGLTSLNASQITTGLLPLDVIPQITNIKIPDPLQVGVISATTQFYGNLTGIAQSATGIIAGSNLNNLGIVTASSIIAVSGSVGTLGITTATVTDRLNVGAALSVTNLVTVGTGATLLTVASNGRIGIGSTTPIANLEVRSVANTLLEVISNTNQARIAIGQSTQNVGTANSSAVLRFGNSRRTFDIINNDQGNFNFIIHNGAKQSGVQTGRWGWFYGQTGNEVLSLTYDGKLGIGKTNPDQSLHVTGNTFVSGGATIGGNLSIDGTLTVAGARIGAGGLLPTNIYASSGVSTVKELHIYDPVGFSSLGIGTDRPKYGFDASNSVGQILQLGVNSIPLGASFAVEGLTLLDSVGVGTTALYDPLDDGAYGNMQIYGQDVYFLGSQELRSSISFDPYTSLGYNISQPRSILDFGSVVGAAVSYGFFIAPTLTTVQRGTITTPINGGIIYNSTVSDFQGYNGAWFGFGDVNVSSTTSTDTTAYPLLVGNVATGYQSTFIDNTTLSYNASTNTLTCTNISDGIGNVRDYPQNSQSTSATAYTLTSTDDGKHILITNTTNGIIVPDGVFSAGQYVILVNNTTSTCNITNSGGGATTVIRVAGDSVTTLPQVLGAFGVATLLCVAANTFVLYGQGVT
jgi:hypothetical protein